MQRVRPTADSYTSIAVWLHWLLAVALFAQLALGWWMLDLPKSPPGLRAGWFNLHKSIGLSIGALALGRLAWRLRHPVAPDPQLTAWQRHAARLTHALLYLCMLALPLSGLLGSNFTRYPVRYFGIALPAWNHEWPAAKELMSALHAAGVWLLMTLVGVHVLAALWHWLRRDAVCARMGLPTLTHLNGS
ncbi:cytochrome b [Ramlibacter sp.]|uniref:cytochrome b n=1 Tax=Ramlibacter sp. TaxID=1917967 RepID=UPI002BCEE037|nr:cytochrome b [Ramlibacter sp.]HWI80488.1 cytochrome b [Ramlibacter sp.]